MFSIFVFPEMFISDLVSQKQASEHLEWKFRFGWFDQTSKEEVCPQAVGLPIGISMISHHIEPLN
jgi:hypothetical protein